MRQVARLQPLRSQRYVTGVMGNVSNVIKTSIVNTLPTGQTELSEVILGEPRSPDLSACGLLDSSGETNGSALTSSQRFSLAFECKNHVQRADLESPETLARPLMASIALLRFQHTTTKPIMLKPILLVEDNPKDLELALIALERSQLANNVVTVRDGVEALDYLFRRNEFAHRIAGNPAVVLLDLKLPKVNGLEVLKTIRASEELKSVPVAMLTSSLEEPDLKRAYELGTNSYIVKPVKFQEFVSAIAGLGVFWAVLNEPPPNSL